MTKNNVKMSVILFLLLIHLVAEALFQTMTTKKQNNNPTLSLTYPLTHFFDPFSDNLCNLVKKFVNKHLIIYIFGANYFDTKLSLISLLKIYIFCLFLLLYIASSRVYTSLLHCQAQGESISPSPTEAPNKKIINIHTHK